LKEGLLYAGTDDGLIQVKEGDADWRRIDKFPFVPEMTYVSRILPSQHAEQTVYASFDNHKMGDFRPYLLKSTDAGRSWTSVSGDLPERGSVLAIAEDHKDADLLFVGTEFGLYFTLDGGKKWVRLKGGVPTIAVRDLAIQKGENDLVVATFGRGFYVLDDYSLLRGLKPDTLQKEANLFPVKDALLYMPTRQYGLRGKAFLGEAFFTAENAPFGATFTYHLKEEIKTKKQQRLGAEKKAETAPYPSREELRAETEEEAPAILLTIADAEGHEVRTVTGPAKAGFHRVTWDLRDPAATLPRQRPGDAEDDIFLPPPGGPLVMPGRYTVTLSKRVDGKAQKLAEPVEFSIVPEGATSMDVAALKELREFQVHVWKLQRAVSGTLDAANELSNRLQSVQRALDQTPGVRPEWQAQVRDMEKRNREVLRALRGDVALQARNENTPTSISERVAYAVDSSRLSLARPTATERESYRIANEEFGEVLPKLRRIAREELPALEKAMEAAGAPWTPGRLPEWKEK
jgi:hypothetical protein